MNDETDKKQPGDPTPDQPEAQGQQDDSAMTKQDDEQNPAATEEKKPDTAHKKTTRHRKHKSSSNTGLLLLSLLIALGACGGVYYLWQNDLKIQFHEKTRLSELDSAISSVKQAQSSLADTIQSNIDALRQEQQNLQHNLTALVRDSKHLRNDWLMAEAEYLIKLANHRLLLEKDVETAQVALSAADQRLAEVGDPSVLKLRQSISNDIQALKNVPRVDHAGISVIITAMVNNIRQLPLRTPDPHSRQQQQDSNKRERQISELSELPGVIWEDIRNLIVIRQHDKPVEPLLAPEQHFFLSQNLELQLEQARLASLKGQATVYQDRLTRAMEWIRLFYDTEHNTTINMLNTLQELHNRNIDPPVPDISGTYKLLQDFRLRGARQDKPANGKTGNGKTPEAAPATEKPAQDTDASS